MGRCECCLVPVPIDPKTKTCTQCGHHQIAYRTKLAARLRAEAQMTKEAVYLQLTRIADEIEKGEIP